MQYEAPEVETVKTRRIHCDGKEGALGHPRVYLSIGLEGYVDCPYCDKRFILDQSAPAEH